MKRNRGIIRGRTAPMIQLCPTCGQMRIHHPDAKLFECPTPAEVIERLRTYKAENGKQWKAKLRALWTSGKDDGLLRQARNFIGPRCIDKIKLG